MDWREGAKKRAALEAVKHVQEGFIIGLGSGTTVAHAVQEIGEKVRLEGLRVLGIPTSHQILKLAVNCGIPLTTLDEHPQLDLTIDGADQVDGKLNLIKGMGGALMREKIVASATKQLVIVVDETKLVEKLGVNQPVPVEVLPFASSIVMTKIRELKGKPVLREGKNKVGPVMTDNGNFILDVNFEAVDDPGELDVKLRLIPGVLETGLFVGMTDVVYAGGRTGVQKLLRE
ncbi:MAG: ribose 5-phosphate isomerase A [Candidatus Bathyarchaeota archaeon]|nr:MAG: ribose 5-phosphate isomerase A [Candidatus Bathyarchaeota archaeon]